MDQSTKNYEGIYASAFLGAFQHPTTKMVATIAGVKVVPNRRLDEFLKSEVSKRAAAISLQLSQLPLSFVQSPDEIYIDRLADDATTTGSTTPPPQTINDLAKFSIQQAVSEQTFQPPDVFKQVAAFKPFSASVVRVLAESQGPTILSITGVTISGAHVAGMTVSPGFEAHLPSGADPGTPELIEIKSSTRRSGSIALRFTNGTGGVFAILSDFIGNVTVGEVGVSNINYNPSKESGRYSVFEAEKARLDALRASVAAAAKFGDRI